jgi:putative acetyltransferase
MERAAEFPRSLLSQQPRQELDHELLDTGRGDFPVQGAGCRSAAGRQRMLGVPAVDSGFNGQTPVPPAGALVPGAGKRPRLGVRLGGAEDVKGLVQASEIPAWQLSRIGWGRVEAAPADAFPGCDDGGHPQQDAAHVADQIGGIPPGAVRYRPGPVILGRSEQGAGVIPGRAEQSGSLHRQSLACLHAVKDVRETRLPPVRSCGETLRVILRRELPGDQAAVVAVHTAAFARPDTDGVPEARLIEDLRDEGSAIPGLSIVATRDDEVIGHVVCSRGWVGDHLCPGLGPIGVLPGHQRRGVGLALMHGVLAAADALTEPAVVLLGDPGYYHRFGFVLAQPLGLLPPDPSWAQHFQVRALTSWDGSLRGTFRYTPAFDRL